MLTTENAAALVAAAESDKKDTSMDIVILQTCGVKLAEDDHITHCEAGPAVVAVSKDQGRALIAMGRAREATDDDRGGGTGEQKPAEKQKGEGK